MLFQKILTALSLVGAATASPILASSDKNHVRARDGFAEIQTRAVDDGARAASIFDLIDPPTNGTWDERSDNVARGVANSAAEGSVSELEERTVPVIVKQLIENVIRDAEKHNRGDWTQRVIKEALRIYPNHNVFFYRRFKNRIGFRHTANAIVHQQEYKFHIGHATMSYYLVVFKGTGHLVRLGEGGFHNWVFAGWWVADKAKKIIHFRLPRTAA